MDLRVRRDIHDDVAEHLRLASEPPALGEALVASVRDLDLVERAEVLRARGDAVLRVLALGQDDLTSAADPAAAAHRVEIDAELARAVEHRRPGLELAAPARRNEDDPGAHDVAASPTRAARPPRRRPSATGACSRCVAIHALQSRSLPIITSAAFTASRTSACRGDVIALVRPFEIAIARNAPFSSLRLGNPNDTVQAPHVVVTPSSSWSRRSSANTCRPAEPIAPIGMTSGSTTMSSFGMP